MKLLERVILGVIRRPMKSFLMFCVMTVVTIFLSGSIILYDVSQSTFEEINDRVSPTISLVTPLDGSFSFSTTKSDNYEMYNRLKSVFQEISKFEEVRYYDLGIKYNNIYKESNLVENEKNQIELATFFSNSDEIFYTLDELISVTNPIPYYFESGSFKLVEGRLFTEEEVTQGAAVVLMPKRSSVVIDGKTKITEVGDKIKLSFKIISNNLMKYNDQMYSEENNEDFRQEFLDEVILDKVFEVEVIGLYEYEEDLDKKDIGLLSDIEVMVPNTYTDKIYREFYNEMNHLLETGSEFSLYVIGESVVNNTERTYKYNKFLLNDSDDIKSFRKKISKVLYENGFEELEVDFGSELYLKVVGPIESMNSISKIMIALCITMTIFVVGIISIIMIKDRIKEIGILLSIGESKKKIMIQILCEILLISFLGCSFSFVSTKFVSQEMGKSFYQKGYYYEEIEISESSVLGGYTEDKVYEILNNKLESNSYINIILLSNLFAILISGCSVVLIMKLNPKDILM